MKLHVVGFEVTQGTSKKTGKPYAIGKLHAVLPLAPAQGDGNIAKGLMGSEFKADVSVLEKISHLQPPFMAEVEQHAVMRFGERQTEIASIVPVDLKPLPAKA